MSKNTLALFDQLADAEQSTLTDVFASQQRQIRGCAAVFRDTVAELRVRGWKSHDAIWNAGLFLNTVTYDLSVYVVQLAYERDEWRRKLVARNLATLMFEIAEDLPSVFGREFNKSLNNLNVPEGPIAKFREQMRRVSEFWEVNRSWLKLIRTVCGAHRDHDALLMHQTIDGIDEFEFLRFGVELGNQLNSIGKYAQVMIDFTSSVRPPETLANG